MNEKIWGFGNFSLKQLIHSCLSWNRAGILVDLVGIFRDVGVRLEELDGKNGREGVTCLPYIRSLSDLILKQQLHNEGCYCTLLLKCR